MARESTPRALRLAAPTTVMVTSLMIAATIPMLFEPSLHVWSAPKSVAPATHLIDINVADAAQLELLPDIGPALALRIEEDRNRHGAFATLESLGRVKGVGPATLKAIEPYAVVASQPR